MGTSIFYEVKSRLDIKEVFERYTGREVHKNKALCPFHNDTNPSLSFKSNKFRCFVCGDEASGTSLDLVSKLFNLSILEAAEKLSQDYNLGLFSEKLSKKQKYEVFKNMQRQKVIKMTVEAFNDWKNKLEKFFTDVYRNLREIFIVCAPKNFEEPHKAWFLAANYIEPLSEILDDFLKKPKEKLLQNYKIYNGWKQKLQKEIEEL